MGFLILSHRLESLLQFLYQLFKGKICFISISFLSYMPILICKINKMEANKREILQVYFLSVLILIK